MIPTAYHTDGSKLRGRIYVIGASIPTTNTVYSTSECFGYYCDEQISSFVPRVRSSGWLRKKTYETEGRGEGVCFVPFCSFMGINVCLIIYRYSGFGLQ